MWPLDIRLGGVVVKCVGFWAEQSGVRIPVMPLFYWVATLGKMFTHIASLVFSAPRNCGTKGSIQTGPI